MGMHAYYLEVTPEQLEAMKASPDTVGPLINSLTLHGDKMGPGPAMMVPTVDLQPLLILLAFFVFIWFAWGRLVKNSTRRRIFGCTLTALGVLALCAAYHVQSSRQQRNFSTVKTLEAARPLNVDQSWHVIHFLLTGHAWGGEKPLSNVVLGGVQIGPKMDYGGVRYLTPREVKEVAEALRPITKHTLRFKFKPEELVKQNLLTWHKDDDQNELDGYSETYEEIRAYYLDAAENGNGMLLFIL